MLTRHTMNCSINMCTFIFYYNLELKYFIFNILNKIYVPYLSLCGTLIKITFICVQCKVSKSSLYQSHFPSLVTAGFYFFNCWVK